MKHDFKLEKKNPPTFPLNSMSHRKDLKPQGTQEGGGAKLLIGLATPGKEYENTYHNAGFLFIDYLTKNLPVSNFSAKGGSASGGQFLISELLKSDVYMNESGAFVKKVLKRRNAKPEELLIVHDDSDLTLGSWKFDFDRGSAGHNGVTSVINALGTKKFFRLRIGIRPKTSERTPRKKAGEFVLKKIGSQDKKILGRVFEEVCEKLVS